MWKERGTSRGQPALAEIPDEDSAGSSKRARLEESLDDEPEKMGEDDTPRISPEETLMTKNPERPRHQPVLFWTNVRTCSVGRVGNTQISQNSFTG